MVASSSAPIRREYPATSAQRMAVSLRRVPFLALVPLDATAKSPGLRHNLREGFNLAYWGGGTMGGEGSARW